MIDITEIRVYMTRQNNMSLKELAKRIGKSPATLSRWFDSGDMPVSCAEKISDVLKIPDEIRTKIFLLSK